jgi:hypothetical protein
MRSAPGKWSAFNPEVSCWRIADYLLVKNKSNCYRRTFQMRPLPAILLASITSCCVFGQGYVIATVAGNGIAAFSGDNGPATSAPVERPTRYCRGFRRQGVHRGLEQQPH